ncbi:hypothetical protein C1H76_2684 [Elsinoe australis]|uniref:Uncharacterized protein n=1 Tax=Elsinoe australis TaxID=40998 RepID=A0A4U7B1M1_9PEZI|nr:hypothetical protein C1H76_2684 [Elsinoe australis]
MSGPTSCQRSALEITRYKFSLSKPRLSIRCVQAKLFQAKANLHHRYALHDSTTRSITSGPHPPSPGPGLDNLQIDHLQIHRLQAYLQIQVYLHIQRPLIHYRHACLHIRGHNTHRLLIHRLHIHRLLIYHLQIHHLQIHRFVYSSNFPYSSCPFPRDTITTTRPRLDPVVVP